MKRPPFKYSFSNVLSAAMLVSAMIAVPQPAAAKVNFNSDTGVTLEDLERAGVRAETRAATEQSPEMQPPQQQETADWGSLMAPETGSVELPSGRTGGAVSSAPGVADRSLYQDRLRGQGLAAEGRPGSSALSEDLGGQGESLSSRSPRTDRGLSGRDGMQSSQSLNPPRATSGSYTDNQRTPAAQSGIGSANVGSENRAGASARSPAPNSGSSYGGGGSSRSGSMGGGSGSAGGGSSSGGSGGGGSR